MISAKFYAKATSFPQKNVPFSSLYSFKYTGTGSSNGFINTMEGAKIFFARKATNYLNTVDDILVGEGDVLRIGAKTETKQSGCWSLFDNFKLEFIGFYENSDLIVSLNEYINDSEALLDSKMQTGIKGSLTEAIENSKIIIADQNASYEDLFAAKNKIDEVLNSALLSVESYENLKLALSESEEFLNIFTGTKLANLEKAITNGESKLSDLEASYDNVVEAANNIFVLYRKGTYIPVWMMGDVDNPENNWSMERSIQSKNWILFWEPGYGQDPSVVSDGNYRVNTQNLLDIAENCFSFYSDSLKFITRGRSKTDDSKMIIRLRYTREWEASGSGVDNQIGLLTLTAW